MGKTSRNRRITAAKDIKRRAKAPPPYGPTKCLVSSCHRLTQRSSGRGLSETYCKLHMENLRRHGCPDRGSYRKEEWGPYRKAAREWLRLHRHDQEVQLAATRLGSLMSSAGRSKDATHHAAAVPKEKARIVLARLHEAGKTGGQLLEIALTIMATHSDIGPRGWPEWKPMQIAKLAKRLRGASGTYYPDSPYNFPPRHPRAAGLFMSIIGREIEERAAITSDTIEEVKALRRKH